MSGLLHLRNARLCNAEAVQEMLDNEYYVCESGELRREFVVAAVGQGYSILQSGNSAPSNDIVAISGKDSRLMAEDERLSGYLIYPNHPLEIVGDLGERRDSFSRTLYLV